MKLSHLAPELPEQFVAHRVRRSIPERGDVGLAGDDQRVAVRAQRGGDDARRRDAGLRGHQGGQCLVLDLFEPADRRAARRVAERERAVSPRPSLGVLCIPAEHAHLQRLARLGRADVLRRADPLLGRDPELANADTQFDQRPAHGVRGRHPFGGAECDADENARRQAERDAAQGARRKRCADDDGAECGERRQPGDQRPCRYDQLGTGDREHRDHHRDSQLREPPVGEHAGLDRDPVRLDEAAENRPQNTDDHHDGDQVTDERPSAVPHDVDDDQRRRDQRCREHDPPEPRRPVQELAQRHRSAGVRLGCRGCDHRDQSGRRREGCEQHHVDGPTVSAGGVSVDQQRKARGLTLRWHSLSRHAHPSASRRWRRPM